MTFKKILFFVTIATLLCRFYFYRREVGFFQRPAADDAKSFFLTNTALSEWTLVSENTSSLDYGEVPLDYRFIHEIRTMLQKEKRLGLHLRDYSVDFEFSKGNKRRSISVEIMDEKIVSILVVARDEDQRSASDWRDCLSQQWKSIPVALRAPH